MLHKTVGEIEGIPPDAPSGMEYREFRYWQIWAWAKETERPKN
jgi:hypothetical protein